jgi:hypothetical protein
MTHLFVSSFEERQRRKNAKAALERQKELEEKKLANSSK